MKPTQHGLFASYLSSLTATLPLETPTGVYDPTEQVWKDEGTVLAWCGQPGARCAQNSDCCPVAGILAICALGECILN